MIISHEHRFVFVKTHKTAGSSIEGFLERLAGEDAVVTPLMPPHDGHRPRNTGGPWNPLPEIRRKRMAGVRVVRDDLRRGERYYEHMRAKLIRDRLGHRRWDRYFTFCFERDPWEKVVSSYHFQVHRGAFEGSLDDYVAHHRLPTDWAMYTIDGAIAVDLVGRYEDLESDLRRALDHIGLDVDIDLPSLKSGVRPATGGADLTPESDRRIADVFRREIAHFGYPDRSRANPGATA